MYIFIRHISKYKIKPINSRFTVEARDGRCQSETEHLRIIMVWKII